MLAALAIVAALQLRGAAPSSDEALSGFAAGVASLRLRWYAGLDAAGWDVDAPAARRLADELTAEALALRARNPGSRAGADAFALDALIGRMGGAPIFPLVRARPIEFARWIEPWLRWGNPRPEEVQGLIDEAGLERGLMSAIARWRPAYAEPLLRNAAAHSQWDAACTAVLDVPPPLQAGLASLVGEGAQVAGPSDGVPACVAALPALPRTRALAAQRLSRGLAVEPGPSPGWSHATGAAQHSAYALGLSVALAGTAHDAVARRTLSAALRSDRDARGDVAAFQAVRMVARVFPWLHATPGLARATRALSLAAGSAGWHLTTARLRARDPDLLGDSLLVLAAPGSRDALLLWSARVVGAGTPSSAESRRRAASALRSFAQATQDEHPTLRSAEALRWVEALAAEPCADAACLLDAFERGSDERAAREVFALGGRIAELPPAVSRALVARVVQRGRAGREPAGTEPGLGWSSTAWAVFATVEGCPSSLRGLREAGLAPNDADMLVTPWRDALDRACREARRAPP